MTGKKNFTRVISLFCVLALLFSMIPNITAAEGTDSVNHCLKVVTGTAQWNGVEITPANLGMVVGNTYRFTFKVYSPDIPVGIVLQTNTYGWVASAGASTFSNKGWYTLTGTYTHTSDVTKFSIVKMGDSGNYDSQIATFYIDDFVVTDTTNGNAVLYSEGFEGSSHKFTRGNVTISVAEDPVLPPSPPEPSEGNHCLKVITGENQWEGANIKASDLGLELGRKYTFSVKVYTPNMEVGILLQHTNQWIHIINQDFYTPDVKEWRQITGTFDTSSVTELFNIQITKAGGKVNEGEEVTFYIDDFIVTDANTGSVIFSEDFEGASNKFTSGGSVISVVNESVITEVIPEEPVKGEYALDVTPLKEIYKDYFLIGNIVNPSDFGTGSSARERYSIFIYHYDILTFENSMKPDAMWGNGSSYAVPTNQPSFSVDQYIKRLQADGILLHGHTLAWHGQSPNWLNLSSGSRENSTAVYKPYSEARANLELFISTVAGHYYNNSDGLSVYSWDVLNEAVRRNSSYSMTEENWGYHTWGHIYASPQWNSPWYLSYSKDAPAGVNPWDYVYDAFYYARQADPSTTLYYNDYGMEDPNQVTMVVNMVNAVNRRYAAEHPEANGRLLIEGIGMQEHDSITTNLANVEKAIAAYIATGCKVSITELDVGVPGYTKADTLSFEDELKQALYFAKLFNIFKKYSYGIERVTFWGLDDDHNWRGDDHCQIFDGKLNTKLAYYAIADPDGFIEKYSTDPIIPTDSLEATASYGTPVIGGAVEDAIWDIAETLPVIRHLNVNYGATGTAKVLWDEENLYVQIKVKDSLLNKASANVWEQDSVEVFFNEINSKLADYSNGMGQYRINYDNLQSFNLGGATSSDGFESYTKIIDGGYMVEMKIPFQFHTPADGDYIGFDAQINDANDKGTRYDVIMWSDTSGMSYANGSNWGSLKLIGKPAANITVNFPGIDGVTLEYYTDSWETAGIFDDTGVITLPYDLTASYIIKASKAGMSYIFSDVTLNNDGVAVLDVPVETIIVTGINGDCELSVFGSDWVYQTISYAAGQNASFKVFGGSIYQVQITDAGFHAINIDNVEAGAIVDIGDYFYDIIVPDGVTDLIIQSNGVIIDYTQTDIQPGDVITLLKTNQGAVITFVFDGQSYSVDFILDSTNPFDVLNPPAPAGIIITSIENGNKQSSVNFSIRSANGKGYTVYLSVSGEEGTFAPYSNVNYNSKGAHIKGLDNSVQYYAYVVYVNGDTVEISDIVILNPGK